MKLLFRAAIHNTHTIKLLFRAAIHNTRPVKLLFRAVICNKRPKKLLFHAVICNTRPKKLLLRAAFHIIRPVELLFRGAVNNTFNKAAISWSGPWYVQWNRYFVERSIIRAMKSVFRGAVHNTSSETYFLERSITRTPPLKLLSRRVVLSTLSSEPFIWSCGLLNLHNFQLAHSVAGQSDCHWLSLGDQYTSCRLRSLCDQTVPTNGAVYDTNVAGQNSLLYQWHLNDSDTVRGRTWTCWYFTLA